MQGLLLLTAHLFGDFVIQTDWMANNKKNSSWACGIHVGTYMLPFLVCGLHWWQLALIAVQHFAQDRSGFITWFLQTTGKREMTEAPMAPWSIIVVDNSFHLAWITAVILMGAGR
ncbi:MAG: DUF3307 domain-containing protein [Xanthomonadaceae bacterium]|nr:DUF3307 domain-containing protein [Xanthomonadaceae bacterium]